MVTTRQLSFSGGEISPALYGRVDQVKYATGLRTCRNGIVMRHGGVANRPGTRFITEVKDSTKKVGLIPFVFNPTQTYVLEFGDQYIRFIKDGAQLALTSAGVDDWVTATSYVVGDLVEEPGASGNFFYCILDHTSGGANQPPNATFWYAIPGSEYEIPTPYLEAELPDLRFVQSADVITITHPNHAPRDLSRTADTTWTLVVIDFSPTIDAPTSPAVAGGVGANTFTYHITSIASETFEESLAVTVTQGTLTDPSTGDPHTITWITEPAAQEFNVYLEVNGVPGFIGVAQGTQFINDGIVPLTTDTPPITRNPFSGAGNFPSTVSYFQQRLIFANSNNEPETVNASRTGLTHNFTRSTPLQDDDAITFTLQSRQVNEIEHLLDLGTLIVFTAGGEWAIQGDEAGILKPLDVNSKQHSYNGSGARPPLVVGGTALYLQARGAIVRDLAFDFQVDGYRGNDLTIFAAHLFDLFTIEDWTYQQIPHSVVWAVRNDGTLLGLTYVREHQVWGWHRHDTDGTFENVTSIPAGNEDDLYVVVRRNINGTQRRYIERMATRQVSPATIKNSIYMDSSLSFDGTNTDDSHTMTLSGGPPWTALENLTLTSNLSFFLASDAGNAIHLTDPADGREIRCRIEEFTSDTVVTVKPHRDVPVTLQNVAVSTWCRAVDQVAGLSHLEGKQVSVLGDGFVVASPNNKSHDVLTVTAGSITLDRPYCVIHVGLPYLFDLETLDIDTVQGETLVDKNKLITGVTLFVETSRGIFTGAKPPSDDTVDPLEGLTEAKLREQETMDEPVALLTGTVEINFAGEWNSNGRLFGRQVDPIPLAILAVAPAGLIPLGR